MRRNNNVVEQLGIPNFDDPYSGLGILAAKNWTKHVSTSEVDYVKEIIAHNIACVLKEYSILVRRGYREIEPSSCKEFFDGSNELAYGNCGRLL